MEKAQNTLLPDDDPSFPSKMLEMVIGHFINANSLKQLSRFAGTEQPILPAVPLPDGSNCEYPLPSFLIGLFYSPSPESTKLGDRLLFSPSK
jgi:hypothetical protein